MQPPLDIYLIPALDFNIRAQSLKVRSEQIFVAELGVLFRYDPDGSVHRMIENVAIPNGNENFAIHLMIRNRMVLSLYTV